MKREGRQHGMVRTTRILPSPFNPKPNHKKLINKLDSPPTAGLFTKVQSKPTNHSKFTGKCGKPRCNECHIRPCCKSKDKAKGSQKFRSCDVASNYRLISWRAVDGQPRLNFIGSSATGMVDHLASNDYVDYDYEDYDYDGDDYDDELMYRPSATRQIALGVEIKEIVGDDENCGGDYVNNDDEDDDVMSFCDVGLLLDQVEAEEGWCLVADV